MQAAHHVRVIVRTSVTVSSGTLTWWLASNRDAGALSDGQCRQARQTTPQLLAACWIPHALFPQPHMQYSPPV